MAAIAGLNPMDITAKKTDLESIYRRYEADVAEFKRGAFCKSGCAYCCTHYGTVDMTTLEGLHLQVPDDA